MRSLEEQVREAEDPDALKYADAKAVDVFRAVLEVALEDDQLSSDELNLIRRLREKLGLHEKTRRILLARLDHFPRKGNVVHSTSDFRDVLIDIQKRGVVFYCNRLDNGCYVVPEEIVAGVKDAMGIEMTRVGWEKLLETLTGAQLGAILEDAGLPKTGKKAELQDRVRRAGLCRGAVRSPRHDLSYLFLPFPPPCFCDRALPADNYPGTFLSAVDTDNRKSLTSAADR